MFSEFVKDETLVFPKKQNLMSPITQKLSKLVRLNFEKNSGSASCVGLHGILIPREKTHLSDVLIAQTLGLLSRENWPDVFIFATTLKHEQASTIFTLDIQTSRGRAYCDRILAHALMDRFTPKLKPNLSAFFKDTSWHRSLLILQELAYRFDRRLNMLPLFLGNLNFSKSKKLGRLLSEILFDQRKRGCFLALGNLIQFDESQTRFLWLKRARSVPKIKKKIKLFEAPILKVIEECDQKKFEKLGKKAGIKERAQIIALMEFALTRGKLFKHTTLVKNIPKKKPKISSMASVVYALHQQNKQTKRKTLRNSSPLIAMCKNVLLKKKKNGVEVFHRCDQRLIFSGTSTFMIIQELLGGIRSMKFLTHRINSKLQSAYSIEDVKSILRLLHTQGFLHEEETQSHRPSKFLRKRLSQVISQARKTVPYYKKSLKSNELSKIPFLFGSTIKDCWMDFFKEGTRWTGKAGSKFHSRKSSSTTGKVALQTVVEKKEYQSRNWSKSLVYVRDGKWRSVLINRPTNLGLSGDIKRLPWRKKGRKFETLSITPGENPSKISNNVWDRCIKILLKFDPLAIHADPIYLAGLARRCLMHGIKFSNLRCIELGHSYAWKIFVDPIQKAFQVPISFLYHSSEVGNMGISCKEGNLHLLETNQLYEILNHGKQSKIGEMGEVVLSTLGSEVRPLIRYVTGDVVRLVSASCHCGLPFRTIRFEGRVRDLFKNKRGQLITYTRLDRAIGAPAGIAFFRLKINNRHASLHVVPTDACDIASQKNLKNRVEECIERDVRIFQEKSLDIKPGGKLTLLQVPNHSDYWHQVFLGFKKFKNN